MKIFTAIVITGLIANGCSDTPHEIPTQKTQSSFWEQNSQTLGPWQISDEKTGSGKTAQKGHTINALISYSLEGDSEVDAKDVTFRIGEGELIRGVDEGVVGMKEGGQRKLTLPPQFAYGRQGIPGKIPPNTLIIVTVQLKKVF